MKRQPHTSETSQSPLADAARLRTLLEIGRIANSSLDVQRVFYRIAEELRKIYHSDYVSLILVDQIRSFRQGFAFEFGEPPLWENLTSEILEKSGARRALEQSATIHILDLSRERSSKSEQRLSERGFRSCLYQPLTCREAVIGVLGMATRERTDRGHWEQSFLSEVGRILGPAFDNVRAYAEIRELQKRLQQENVYLRDEINSVRQTSEMIGASAALDKVRAAIEQVAPTDSTVLISGETGTGKELIARAIHEQSPRRKRLLVSVNCAALGPGVITSELFGHEAGAFTGADRRRRGRFELANGGTIFLDEIAETPAETQVMLLRVLQERRIERVGGSEPIPVDVRVIAACNRDLTDVVNAGEFRADVFYRLNVFPIHVPPLRERTEDIPLLAAHFLNHFASKMNKTNPVIEPRTVELLMHYHWPGNVRELEHLIERAMIVSQDASLHIDPAWFTVAKSPAISTPQPLAELERQTIVEALNRCGGKIYGPSGAAAALGLKPTTLYGRMRKHAIERNDAKHFE